jgi:hypothetical protein
MKIKLGPKAKEINFPQELAFPQEPNLKASRIFFVEN